MDTPPPLSHGGVRGRHGGVKPEPRGARGQEVPLKPSGCSLGHADTCASGGGIYSL